jgi:hypothetical protein
LAQHAQMVAAKHTCADDGDSNLVQNLTYHVYVDPVRGNSTRPKL